VGKHIRHKCAPTVIVGLGQIAGYLMAATPAEQILGEIPFVDKRVKYSKHEIAVKRMDFAYPTDSSVADTEPYAETVYNRYHRGLLQKHSRQ
jgi:hypothetical protein